MDISTELDIAVSGAKVCRPGVMPHPLACLSVCVPRPAVSIVLLCFAGEYVVLHSTFYSHNYDSIIS